MVRRRSCVEMYFGAFHLCCFLASCLREDCDVFEVVPAMLEFFMSFTHCIGSVHFSFLALKVETLSSETVSATSVAFYFASCSTGELKSAKWTLASSPKDVALNFGATVT